LDTRECRSHNPFAAFNDPVCEASKGAQNALFDAQKAACEAQKTSFKAACESKKDGCRKEAALCATLMNAEIGSTADDTARVQAIFKTAQELPSELFPKDKIPASNDLGLPPGYELRYSIVESTAFAALRWGPFQDNSLSVLAVQDRLVFKKPMMAVDGPNSIQVWRALIWLAFLQKYGTDGVVQAMKLSPGVLEKAADAQIAALCLVSAVTGCVR